MTPERRDAAERPERNQPSADRQVGDPAYSGIGSAGLIR